MAQYMSSGSVDKDFPSGTSLVPIPKLTNLPIFLHASLSPENGLASCPVEERCWQKQMTYVNQRCEAIFNHTIYMDLGCNHLLRFHPALTQSLNDSFIIHSLVSEYY